MYGVGCRFRQMERKIREFFANQVKKKFDRKLFTLKMPDVGNHQTPFGIEKLVVLEIGAHKNVGAGPKRVGYQKTAGASAHRHALHWPAPKRGVAYAGGLHAAPQVLQKIDLGHGPGQLAENNAQQVKKVRQILEGLGLEIASPDEAREILSLKGGDKVAF